MITEITVNVSAEDLMNETGLDMNELEKIEADLDSVLYGVVSDMFPEADVKASAFYVNETTVRAYDENEDEVRVSLDIVKKIIVTAVSKL